MNNNDTSDVTYKLALSKEKLKDIIKDLRRGYLTIDNISPSDSTCSIMYSAGYHKALSRLEDLLNLKEK